MLPTTLSRGLFLQIRMAATVDLKTRDFTVDNVLPTMSSGSQLTTINELIDRLAERVGSTAHSALLKPECQCSVTEH
jgi:hypothetical protein